MSTTSGYSVLLKYRSNSLAKREKKKKKKRNAVDVDGDYQTKSESYMCIPIITRRQGINGGKLSLHNERMKKNREKKK